MSRWSPPATMAASKPPVAMDAKGIEFEA